MPCPFCGAREQTPTTALPDGWRRLSRAQLVAATAALALGCNPPSPPDTTPPVPTQGPSLPAYGAPLVGPDPASPPIVDAPALEDGGPPDAGKAAGRRGKGAAAPPEQHHDANRPMYGMPN